MSLKGQLRPNLPYKYQHIPSLQSCHFPAPSYMVTGFGHWRILMLVLSCLVPNYHKWLVWISRTFDRGTNRYRYHCRFSSICDTIRAFDRQNIDITDSNKGWVMSLDLLLTESTLLLQTSLLFLAEPLFLFEAQPLLLATGDFKSTVWNWLRISWHNQHEEATHGPQIKIMFLDPLGPWATSFCQRLSSSRRSLSTSSNRSRSTWWELAQESSFVSLYIDQGKILGPQPPQLHTQALPTLHKGSKLRAITCWMLASHVNSVIIHASILCVESASSHLRLCL